MTFHKPLFVVCSLVWLVCVHAGSANMDDRSLPLIGVAGEPGGCIPVDVTKETLSIDMQAAPAGRPILVEAIYHLHNQGNQQELSLYFHLCVPCVRSFSAWHNDTPIPCGKPNLGPMSVTLEDGSVVHYDAMNVPFQLTVAPGRHKLRVRYTVEPSVGKGGAGLKRWQVAYVLAPARAWKSFGGLEVEVFFPAEYKCACNVPIQQDGMRWTGRYSSLPADYLCFTTQLPVPWINSLRWPLLLAFCFGGYWWCHSRGKHYAARHGVKTYNPWTLLCALAWTTVMLPLLYLILVPGYGAPSGQRADPWDDNAVSLFLTISATFTFLLGVAIYERAVRSLRTRMDAD